MHSFLYYQLNQAIIDDVTYDKWAMELYQLQINFPKESRKAIYFEVYKDFDGSSGFDLPFTNPDIQNIGYRLLQYLEKNKKSF
nr:hypothetical protein [Oceanobacillus sojae]